MEQQLNEIVKEILTQLSTPGGVLTLTAGTLGSIKIYHEYLQRKIRTKLIRENIVENCKLIDKVPEITHLDQKNSNIENYPKINEIVTNFKNTLESKLTKKQMNIVRKNLDILQYKPRNIYGILSDTIHCTAGFYIEHSITSNPLSTMNINHILAHELLHASTSSGARNRRYSGFCQCMLEIKKLKILGNGINEGYTELLTRRLFGYEHTSYNYEVAVAEMVELIVGKEKMQDLYFNLDLNGLINALGKYSDKNKTKQFILNLDTINSLSQHKGNDDLRHTLSQLYNQNSAFLYEAFQNKTNQYLSINTTSKYFDESNKFQHLFSQIEINNRYNLPPRDKKSLKNILLQTKNILHNFKITQKQTQKNNNNIAQNINKPKTLTKSKPSTPTNNTKGFINILTISTLLTILSLLSIGVSYLLLQAR